MRDPKSIIKIEDFGEDEMHNGAEVISPRARKALERAAGKPRSSNGRRQAARNSRVSEKVLRHAAGRAERAPSANSTESAAAGRSPEELRARAGVAYNVLSRLSMRFAPLCSWMYDCQMSIGKGVRLVSHRLQLPNYPSGAPALKAAFLSDLHYGPTTGRIAARQAWKLVRDANPDVIFLGGDYLFADERGLPTLLRELQRWKYEPPPGGIYACLGNHDYYAGKETITTCLEACGVKVLVNGALPLPSPWKGVWIAGVDDMLHGKPDLGQAIERVSPDACTVLLSHEPDICESNLLRRVAVTLSGHTHGGQVCFPNGEAPFIPSKHGREYSGGLYRHAGQWLFVSRGVGTVGLPVRLFAPPDVGIFEFHGRTMRNTR